MRLILVGIGIIVIGGFIFINQKEDVSSRYSFVKIEERSVLRFVDVTGVVRPLEFADVSFEVAGHVTRVPVQLGSEVRVGQVLANISASDVGADVASAQARLEAELLRVPQLESQIMFEEQRLAEIKQGAREEEIALSQNSVSKFEKQLHLSLEDAQQAYGVGYDDVVYSIDGLLSGVVSGQFVSSYDLLYPVCDPQLETNLEWDRWLLSEKFNTVSSDVTLDYDDLLREYDVLIGVVESALHFVDGLSVSLSQDCNRTDVTLDAKRASVDTARGRIKTTLSGLRSHRAIVVQAQLDVSSAISELQLVQALPRDAVVAQQMERISQAKQALAQQEAVIQQARSGVWRASALYQKHVLRSPVAGTVVNINVKQGDYVTPAQMVMRVAVPDAYEIEVFVPESDVIEVKRGAEVRIYLDAFGSGTLFKGTVRSIETGETFIEGVPTYKTSILLDATDKEVLSGMTADVEIVVDETSASPVLPVRAVLHDNGRRFVRQLIGNEVIERTVEVGLKGSDGYIEVISPDLRIGDEVILFEK